MWLFDFLIYRLAKKLQDFFFFQDTREPDENSLSQKVCWPYTLVNFVSALLEVKHIHILVTKAGTGCT